MKDEVIILTGMSGAGKTTAIFAFEEMRYQVVENPPADLFPSLFQLIHQQLSSTKSVVSVTLYNLSRAIKAAASIPGLHVTVLCLVANENDLISRYKLTRHIHPLQTEGYTLAQAIARDAQLVNEIRPSISTLLDTSGLSVTNFRQRLINMFSDTKPHLTLGLVTFGFKHGLPLDADFVFDLRLLQNPYYDEGLKNLTGLDPKVIEYVETQPLYQTLLTQALAYLKVVIPQLLKEERPFYEIAIGCTGGKHRSVVFAQALSKILPTVFPVGIMMIHRDIHKAADQE
jgi:RNase adapter protein RapZ